MKRIRMWLRQMSLTQQLVAIVFMFVIILVVTLIQNKVMDRQVRYDV